MEFKDQGWIVLLVMVLILLNMIFKARAEEALASQVAPAGLKGLIKFMILIIIILIAFGAANSG